jgi:hypothetical protein
MPKFDVTDAEANTLADYIMMAHAPHPSYRTPPEQRPRCRRRRRTGSGGYGSPWELGAAA